METIRKDDAPVPLTIVFPMLWTVKMALGYESRGNEIYDQTADDTARCLFLCPAVYWLRAEKRKGLAQPAQPFLRVPVPISAGTGNPHCLRMSL